MPAAWHHFPPSMPFQYPVDLICAYLVINRRLTRLAKFPDFHNFSSFSTGLEGGQNRRLFFLTHVLVISSVVVSGNCFQPFSRYFFTIWLTYSLQNPVACETSFLLIPFARSSRAFRRCSARLSLFFSRSAWIASISFSLNWYLLPISFTPLHFTTPAPLMKGVY